MRKLQEKIYKILLIFSIIMQMIPNMPVTHVHAEEEHVHEEVEVLQPTLNQENTNYLDVHEKNYLDDGVFRLLLIGNSYSQDASNFYSKKGSQLLDILRAMLPETVKIEIGLIYSGGKSLAWHATQAYHNAGVYGFYKIDSDTGVWSTVKGSSTSQYALEYADWDVVTLQPYGPETTTGVHNNAAYNENYYADEQFINLKDSLAYMLDHVDLYAPDAETYFYLEWTTTRNNKSLNQTKSTFDSQKAVVAQSIEEVTGTNSQQKIEDIIPVGTAVQNARSTYFGLLSYNESAYDDGNLNLVTDGQIGILRDGGHVTYYIGRYIAALTFAETIIPQSMRKEGYKIPSICVTESIGKLPEEYTEIAQKCVYAALESENYKSTSIEGYTVDPAVAAAEIVSKTEFNLPDTDNKAGLIEGLTSEISGLIHDEVEINIELKDEFDPSADTFAAEVSLRFGYTTKTVEVSGKILRQMTLRYDDHLDVTGKTVEILNAGTPTSYQVGYGVAEGTLDSAVVALEGNDLVATGIGAAYVMIDGAEYEVTVEAAPISLILLAGQSNMQGIDGNASQSIVCPDGMVYSTYGHRYKITIPDVSDYVPSALTGDYREINVNGTTEYLSDYPVYGLTEQGAGKEGPDSGFAYEWVKQTGEKIWVVNMGYGGSSINTWIGNGSNYQDTLAVFGACQDTLQKEIAAGHYTLSHMGYYWLQGCADETQTAKWYVEKYLTMHDNLKKDFSFDHDSNPLTAEKTFEFGGIIPIRSGHQGAGSYRAGAYTQQTSANYFQSFKDLRMNGPRVAQYWMGNNPELTDIYNVCTIQEEWATMPDGTDGVASYFKSAYADGKVDYPVQVKQSASWYTPKTPYDVHDNIHYNQIGYNEIGRESVRNTMVYLGINEPETNQASVEFVSWDGFTPVNQMTATPFGSSMTLAVPMVSPVYLSKDVTYQTTEGLTYNYYDVLSESVMTSGTLASSIGKNIAVSARDLTSYRWTFDGADLANDVSYGDSENSIVRAAGSISNNLFKNLRYQIAQPIVLQHDQSWAVEWSMNVGANTAAMMLSTESTSNGGQPYLYVRAANTFVGLGYYNGSNYYHVGYYMSDFDIDMTKTHVYRLVNKIENDGSNMIYLFVDGEEIGPMNQKYQGSTTYQGVSDWVSGKDFAFSFMGTSEHLMTDMRIDYLTVKESNATDVHFHNYSAWKETAAPSKEAPGQEERTCSGCSDVQTRTINGVWQNLDFAAHFSVLPENYCSKTNLWLTSEHDKYYLIDKGTWGIHDSGNVFSITIPVSEGDHVYATSFGKAGTNGHASSNGIRMTWLNDYGVVKTLTPQETYAEFTNNGGYLIVPEGVTYINIPLWSNSDTNEVYILNAEHQYESGTCTACGQKNPDSLTFAGKKLSILGDSISTFTNYSSGTAANTTNSTIKSGAVYYNGNYGVTVNDTWWKQIADQMGMEILVNNSWSGSCILTTRSGTVGAYVDRAVQLHDNTGDNAGEEPDIIAVYLGTNDFSHFKSTLGSYEQINFDSLISKSENQWSYADPATASEAYAIMLHKMTERYPDAEVYCFTLLPRLNASASNVQLLEGFNSTIKKLADKYGAYVVDLYEDGGITKDSECFSPYIADNSVHPGLYGMDMITTTFASSLLSNSQYASNTEVFDVNFNLSNVIAQQGTAYAAEGHKPFEVQLIPFTDCSFSSLSVKMDGIDITEEAVHENTVRIEELTGHLEITAAAVEIPKDAENYYWERVNGILTDASSSDYHSNAAVQTSSSSGVYKLEKGVVLYHDRPWSIIWSDEGKGGYMVFSNNLTPTTDGNVYLYKSSESKGLMAIGFRLNNQYNNYGFALSKTDVDWTKPHQYEIRNHIDGDTNTLHLYVDDVYAGPMTDYYLAGSNLQNENNTYLSGKDFRFNYLGSSTYALGTGTVTSVKVWENGRSESMKMKYDDHLDMTGKTIKILDAGTPTSYQVGYGVAEGTLDSAVVTLKDNTLIATGIGTAFVSIDSIKYEITVEAAPISLILLAGQSNMRGSEGDPNQSIVCPDGMVYSTYGDDRGADNTMMTKDNAAQFVPSALTGQYSTINTVGTTNCLSGYPVNALTEDGQGKIGPDSGFAYEWVKQTGEKVWVVNAAHGGTSINLWWQKTGKEYKEALALFTAAQETLSKEIAAGHYTLSHMGYYWCQGCSDAGFTAEQYVTKYLAMHENFKADLGFDHDLNADTPERTFEFGGIIPVRAGNATSICYREGVYEYTTTAKYHESFKDLRMTGPRVAQYWMGNNPELSDIWLVCNIGEDWVTMPDGTNGVSAYFNAHYENGTVDYKPQVAQKASWYKPTTPAAVHDSIHYNQIGYNEVGRESVRNTMVYLGINEPENVETTVEFVSWDGFTEVSEINAKTEVSSKTLVVPMVSPIYNSKEVTYTLSDGLSYTYYDLLSNSVMNSGTLMSSLSKGVSVGMKELTSYRWSLIKDAFAADASYGDRENKLTQLAGSISNQIISNAYYQNAEPVMLMHDKEWMVEWSVENWDTKARGATILSAAKSTTEKQSYLYVRPNNHFVGLGYNNGTNGVNFGYSLLDYGYDAADKHTYRLVNRVFEDGTNMVYLFVDGEEIGPLNKEHKGSTTYVGESNWVSGKDFIFPFLGSSDYPIHGMTLNYMLVSEKDTDETAHFHHYTQWEEVSAPSKDALGLHKRTCISCNDEQVREVKGVWQKYDWANHVSELPEKFCSETNLWAELEHDPMYFANGTNWGTHSSNNVPSITIPVVEGDHVFATSFGKAKENGHSSSNGIRMTWFDEYDVLKTLEPAQTYKEFSANGGYLIAPEGAKYINIPLWSNSDDNEVYILNRDHQYSGWERIPNPENQDELIEVRKCEACGFEETREIVYSDLEMYNAFVAYMNRKAQQLGMVNTTFVDPAGIGNFTTAEDIFKLMLAAKDYKGLTDYWGKSSYTVNLGGPNSRKKTVQATYFKYDLDDYYEILGGKTGTLAPYNARNLAVYLGIPESDDQLLVVMLSATGTDGNAQDRYKTVRAIADYVLSGSNEEFDATCKSAIAARVKADGSYEILYQKNTLEKLVPASISKVMTAICALDLLEDKTAVLTYKQSDIDRIGSYYTNDFKVNDEVSFEESVPALILPSSNITAAMIGRTSGAELLKDCAKVGHKYVAYVIEPTCTETGYTAHICVRCDETYKDSYVDALGHDYEGITCILCGETHPEAADYAGKVISIYGDSISTFAGYIPVADGFNLEHLTRYPQDNLLSDVNETWWMQVIDTLDAKLGINDSWRGATVSGAHPVTTGTTGENASFANLTRVQNLGSNGTPDVILFYGGTNDLAHVSKVGTFDVASAPSQVDLTTKKWDNLADGYVHTLLRLKHYYPESVILAMLPTYTTSYYVNTKLAQANEVLKEICNHYDIPWVDLRECGLTTSMLPDGVHPDAEGMDHITTAVLAELMNQNVESGEHVVYSVTHHLNHVEASLGYYKGISAGQSFNETLTSDGEMKVTVLMNGTDITDSVYQNGKITIAEVTGNLVITAESKFSLGTHLKELPEELCEGINLWKVLEHDNEYYAVDGWTVHASNKVTSVTFAVEEGMKIYASSFEAAGTNGGTVNGIRVTTFSEEGVLKSMSVDEVYAEFSKNGYLTVPSGATHISIPMWTISDKWEIYVLSAEHEYVDGICSACGDIYSVIPSGWTAVPLSRTENSTHLAYQIVEGVLTFCDFGDASDEDYGIFAGYTNNNNATSFEIPEWYQNNEGIKKVVFDESISFIGSFVLTNMNSIEEIHIENENAEVSVNMILFSTTNREEALSLYAASTLKTVDTWIRGHNNRKISKAVSSVTMYYTNYESQLKELEDILMNSESVSVEDLNRAYSLLNNIPDHKYNLSDYQVKIEGSETLQRLLSELTSGSCGNNVTYQMHGMEGNQLHLVLSGSGDVTSSPWQPLMESISDVTISDLITGLDDCALPEDAVYHVYLNSEAYDYAKEHGLDVELEALRVLSIGNSHTNNYSTYLTTILKDLQAAGLETKVTFAKSVTGSIGLYSGRNSNVNATYRSHLEGLNSQASAYNSLKNNRYDLIVVQDYMESIADAPEVFAEGLSSFIKKVREIVTENGNGNPEIAWFADWVDIRTTGGDNSLYDGQGNKIKLESLTREEVYAKSLANVAHIEEAIRQNKADMPDFVIHASTIKQNAMSSYLGTSTLYENTKYSLIESDNTHLTSELGCYLMGAGVVSEIMTHYQSVLNFSSTAFKTADVLTLANTPKSTGSNSQTMGSFNAEILDIVRESISSPNQFKHSVYVNDPAHLFAQQFAEITWSFEGLTTQEAILAAVESQIPQAMKDMVDSYTIELVDYESENDFTIKVQITSGYTMLDKEAAYHKCDYQSDVTDPTCTEHGYTTHTCSCGDSYVDSYVDALGHKYDAIVTIPSGTTQGYTTYQCSQCNDNYRTETIDESWFEGKKLVAIGDSITAGVKVTKGETDYVTLIGKELGMTVVNRGASGTTLATGGPVSSSFSKLNNLPTDTDIVTIALGINDFSHAVKDGYYQGKLKYESDMNCYELGTVNSTDTTTIYGALHMWANKIVELKETETYEDVQFYFVTPLIASWNVSISSKRDWDQSKENIHGIKVRDICNAIIEVAGMYDIQVIDLNITSGLYYNSETDNTIDKFGGDGLHPGETGHQMMADAIIKHFKQEFLSEDHEHTYGSWIMTTYPTCTDKGEEMRVCVQCTKTESREVDELSHQYESAVTAPTCEEAGYTTYTCSRGDHSYLSDHVEALGHDEVTDEAVEATCTETGLTEGKHCERCGEVLVAQTVTDKLGHNYTTVVTAPTCEEAGYTTYTCKRGDHSYVSDHVEALGHEEVTDAAVDATCTETGLTEGKHCERCGEVLVAQTVTDKLGHNYTTVVTAPTCEDDGYTTYTCVRCDDSYVDDYTNALGHNYGIVVTAPNCISQGYTTYTCVQCSYAYQDHFTAPTGEHDYVSGTCTGCGHSVLGKDWIAPEFIEGDYSMVVIPDPQRLVHYHPESYYDMMQWIVDNEDTLNIEAVLNMGDMTDTGAAEQWVVSKKGMDLLNSTDIAWMPMMGNHDDSAGFNKTYDYATYGSNRSWFGGSYHANKLDHTYWFVDAGERDYLIFSLGWMPTVSVLSWAEGIIQQHPDKNVIITAHAYLNSDGRLLSKADFGIGGLFPQIPDGIQIWDTFKKYENVVLALSGHVHSEDIVTYVDQNAAGKDVYSMLLDRQNDDTEQKLGTLAVFTFDNDSDEVKVNWYSTRYDAFYREKNQLDITVPHTHVHEYVMEEKQATCTEDGGQFYTCTICGHSYVEAVVPAGHDYKDVVTEPTCAENGYTTHTCSRCGDIYTDAETEALGHKEVIDEAVDATCTETGLTEGRHCERCGEVLAAQTVTDKLGHDYEAVVTEPTCEDAGYTTYTCVRGDHTYVADETEALGHKEVIDEAVDATCTETGLTEGRHCERCGEVLAAQTVTDKLGHDYEAIVVGATCTEYGYTVHQCTRCSDRYEDTLVDKLGHEFDEWQVVLEPTFESEGQQSRECVRCDAYETRPIEKKKHSYVSEVIEPTCTSEGYTLYTCTKCQDSYKDNFVPAVPHAYGQWAIIAEATHSSKGSERRDCENCDAYETRDIAIQKHQYTSTVIAPTCTSEGYTLYECECGDSYQDNYVSTLSHNYGQFSVVTEATCLTGGTKVHSCETCGHEETIQVEPLGHHYKAEVIKPTCTAGGYTTHTCERCGESYTDNYTDAAGHVYGQWVVVVEATCDKGGMEMSDCELCDHYDTRKTEKLGHDYESVVVAPDCMNDGYTEHSCTRCDSSYVDSIIKSNGHGYGQWIVVEEPTCEKEGLEKRICTGCGHEETRHIEMIDHVEVIDPAVDATCTETGLTQGSHCEFCGEVLVKQEITPKTDHEYESVVTESTCLEKGYTTHTCINCSDSYVDSYTEVSEHKFTEWTVEKEATLEKEGVLRRDCEVCGHTERKVLPAKQHTYTSVVVEPTCENGGYTEYTCTECGHRYRDDMTEALGHEFGQWIEVEEAGCETGGIEQRDCTRCEHVEVRVTDPAGHDFKETVVDPTCEGMGYTIFECKVCNAKHEGDFVQATGHTFGQWQQIGELSCTEKGAERRDCEICDAYESRETDAPGHDYQIVETNASCTEGGKTEYVCSRCQDSYIEESVEPLGHQMSEAKTIKEPTCTQQGEEASECERCGHRETNTLPALGHQYVDKGKAPTCTEDGLKAEVCQRCGDKKKEEILNKTGHQMLTETVEASCSRNGYTETVCQNCGETKRTNETAAYGHSFGEYISDNNATVDKDGTKTSKCSRCGAKDTVTDAGTKKVISSVEITAKPLKLTYEAGEALDLTGLEFTVTYTDGKTETVSDFEVSGFDPYQIGKQELTVSYHDFTDELSVEVNEISEDAESSETPDSPSEPPLWSAVPILTGILALILALGKKLFFKK